MAKRKDITVTATDRDGKVVSQYAVKGAGRTMDLLSNDAAMIAITSHNLWVQAPMGDKFPTWRVFKRSPEWGAGPRAEGQGATLPEAVTRCMESLERKKDA